MPTQQYQPLPTTIAHRYRVLCELGRGGFGHTYLVEDIHRFNEQCVLKEFAPAVASSELLLTKARELFRREATVLYQLDHPQIPRFREWFMGEQEESLCLVQDYVEGATYQAILQDRVAQGQVFSEAEVYQFLVKILPVIAYIHQKGLIHRDISPDNLILRQSDGLPILIDFGGVKQLTASLSQGVDPNQPRFGGGTVIGKLGYSPEEQIRLGQVYDHSDLYALGVTALVLLLGKDPQHFYDPNTRMFQWRDRVRIDSRFASLLDTMTAAQPSSRYPSAPAVLKALAELTYLGEGSEASQTKVQVVPRLSKEADDHESLDGSVGFQPEVTQQTVMVEPVTSKPAASKPVVAKPGPLVNLGQRVKTWTIRQIKRLLVLMAIASLGAGVIWAIRYRLITASEPTPAVPSTTVEQPYSQEERDRKARLFDRLEALNVSLAFFTQLTNEAFFLEYPNYQGRALTRSPEDAPLRQSWDEVGFQVLELLGKLDPTARDRLGQYQASDRQAIDQQLQNSRVNPDRFYRRVNNRLVKYLPMYRDLDLANKRAEQLWFAIATDQLQNQDN